MDESWTRGSHAGSWQSEWEINWLSSKLNFSPHKFYNVLTIIVKHRWVMFLYPPAMMWQKLELKMQDKPVLMKIVLLAGEVPNMMQTVIYIWPYMYNSLYGRFLLLQLGGTGNVLILNVLISLYSIVGKVASRSSLQMLMKLMWEHADLSRVKLFEVLPSGFSWISNLL